MRPFLSHTAEYLWEQYGESLSDKFIVFPNKRSVLYFTKYLRKYANSIFRVPECLTINELFLRYSEKVVADKLTLITKLYQSYKNKTNTEEEFPEFYPFANLLLGDFDAIDKHLVDTEQLFQNIINLKTVDASFSYLTEEQIAAIQQFWSSFDVEKHSEQQKFFLQMWQSLPAVYKDFNTELEQLGIAYEGRIFREVTEALQAGKCDFANAEHIFIGFNVLSKAEREVFHLLKKQNKAEFYWDADAYYVDNSHNEAGRFISRNIAEFPCPEGFVSGSQIDEKKEVIHIDCTNEVQQAKVLGEILQKLSEEELPKTAVILANEELLPTVLSSLPKELETVNISMGYPLSETNWMQFLELLVQLHKNTNWRGKQAYFSSEIVQKLLQHPYANYLDKDDVDKLKQKIVGNNRNRVAAGIIKGKLTRILSPISEQTDAYSYLKPLLTYIFAKSESHSADRELMLRTGALAQRIDETLKLVNTNNPQFFWTLLLKELSQQRMPFQAIQEKGLQVIGFLESRLLDFENVYILSANESYLPNISLAGSLIPYNLRIGAGLPTLDEQNSMYAYYFYRLLTRTKQMTLFSVSGGGDLQCAEQSRYITQLQYEAPFKIKETTASATLERIAPEKVEIAKNEEVQQEFQKFFEGKRSLSPSAINCYLRCPQNFYYRYIKGVQDVQILAKAEDSNMFGSIFHKAAELLYLPYVGEEVSVEIVAQLKEKKHLQNIIKKAFKAELFNNDKRELRGKEWLIFDTLQIFLEKLLERDLAYAPFEIVGLEQKMQYPMQVDVDGKIREITLRGSIDRIDKKGGQIRVVDYKTGTIKRNFESIERLFIACDDKRNPTALQTFLYSWVFYKNRNQMPTPCVYELKNITKEPAAEFTMGGRRDKRDFIFAENIEEYEYFLQELLSEIFGSEFEFYPTPNEQDCTHDPHTGICEVFGN